MASNMGDNVRILRYLCDITPSLANISHIRRTRHPETMGDGYV